MDEKHHLSHSNSSPFIPSPTTLNNNNLPHEPATSSLSSGLMPLSLSTRSQYFPVEERGFDSSSLAPTQLLRGIRDNQYESNSFDYSSLGPASFSSYNSTHSSKQNHLDLNPKSFYHQTNPIQPQQQYQSDQQQINSQANNESIENGESDLTNQPQVEPPVAPGKLICHILSSLVYSDSQLFVLVLVLRIISCSFTYCACLYILFSIV